MDDIEVEMELQGNDCMSRIPVLLLTRIEDQSESDILMAIQCVSEEEGNLKEDLHDQYQGYPKLTRNTRNQKPHHDTSEEEDENGESEGSREKFDGSEEEKYDQPQIRRSIGKKPRQQRKSRLNLKTERTCIDCGEIFKSIFKLRLHVPLHQNETPFTCGVCGMRFRDIPALSHHKANTPKHELKKKPTAAESLARRIPWTPSDHICHYCGKKWDSAWELKEHKQVHLTATVFNCELCGIVLKSVGSLRLHFQHVHLGFKHRGSLKKMRQKLKEASELEPEEQKAHSFITCDICGKIFHWVWQLDSHMLKSHRREAKSRSQGDAGSRTAPPTKRFPCDECGINHRSKFSLLQHLKSKKHSDELTLTCETCGRGFRKPDGLRKHIAKKHPEVELPKRYEYGQSISEVPTKSVFDGLELDENKIQSESEEVTPAAAEDEDTQVPVVTNPLETPLPPPPPSETFMATEFLENMLDEEMSPPLDDPVEHGDDVDVKPNLAEISAAESPYYSPPPEEEDEGNDSDWEESYDPETLERLRRACQRRASMRIESNNYSTYGNEDFHESMPLTVKIEEGSEFRGEELEDEPPRLRSRKTPRQNQKKKKRKPEVGMKCRLGGCPFRAPDRDELASHRAEIHGRLEPVRAYNFLCFVPGCSFRARFAESLESHRLTHNLQTRLEGLRSPKNCKNNTPNPSGKKRKPEVGIKCRLSGCRFRALDRDHLATHRVEIHGRAEPVRAYDFKCDAPGCNFRARFAESLESHRLTHNKVAKTETSPTLLPPKGPRPHSLSSSPPPPDKRKVTHPYPCTHAGCTKGFAHRKRLVAHVQHVHLRIPRTQSSVPSPGASQRTGSTLPGSADGVNVYFNPRRCRIQGCKFKPHSRTELETHRAQAHGNAWAKTLRKPRKLVNRNWIYCEMDNCTFRALLPETLTNHQVKQHGETSPKAKYACALCQKVFASNYYRQVHVKLKHSGERPLRLPCKLCPRDFSCRFALLGHVQRAHPSAPTFPCSICHKNFYDQDETTLHEERHRRIALIPGLRYKCLVAHGCQEVFTTQEELQSHVKHVHDISVDARTVCPTCGKECLAYNFGAHQRTHTRQRIRCPHCPREFSKPISLERHKELGHPELFQGREKGFICDLCGMSFHLHASLSLHRKNHRASSRTRARSPRKPKRRQPGDEVKPRRKRRSKKEMEEARMAPAAVGVARRFPEVPNASATPNIRYAPAPPPPPPPPHGQHVPTYDAQNEPQSMPLLAYFQNTQMGYFNPHMRYM